MTIISELPYLKTLLTSDTHDFNEINDLITNAKLLRDQPGYGWEIGSGSDTQGHLVHYIKERDYYVYIHGIVGSCEYCTRSSSGQMLTRATVLKTRAEMLDAVNREMNKMISYGEMDECDRDELIQELSGYYS